MDRGTILGFAFAKLLEAMLERYEVYTELIELEFRPPTLLRTTGTPCAKDRP